MAWTGTILAPWMLVAVLAVVATPPNLAAAQGPGEPLAQLGTSAPTPVNLNPLGPPIPEPGQPSAIPWQGRLRWLQQQLTVLGHDPGPDQELFRRLAQQADAIVAAIPGIQSYPPAAAAMSYAPAAAATPAPAVGTGSGGTAAQPQGPMPEGPSPGQPPGGPPTAGPAPTPRPGDAVAVVFHLAREMERTARNPMQATILAVYGIVDAAGDNPQMGIQPLQAMLDGQTALPARTVIRFALKDLMLKAGDRQGAIQQLQQIAVENSRRLQGPLGAPQGTPPPGGPGGEGPQPPSPGQPAPQAPPAPQDPGQ